MTRATYEVLDEPRGEAYHTLLRLSLQYCDRVMLVVRPSLDLGGAGRSLLLGLDALLISRREESSWPGTELTDSTAEVLSYRLTEDTLAAMSSAAGGLYSWKQPGLPEDPCFMRTDGSPWLFTVTHEREAFLSVDEDELASMKRVLPGLRLSEIRPH